MERNDIIKALECCSKSHCSAENNADCPLINDESCACTLPQNALTLIKQLTEEKVQIFGEIDRLMLDGAIGGKYPAKVINPEKYADLKKNHIGENNGES